MSSDRLDDLFYPARETLIAELWNIAPVPGFSLTTARRNLRRHTVASLPDDLESPLLGDVRPRTDAFLIHLEQDLDIEVKRFSAHLKIDRSIDRRSEVVRLPRFPELFRALAVLTCQPEDLGETGPADSIWVWSNREGGFEVEPWSDCWDLLDAAGLDMPVFERICKICNEALDRLFECPESLTLRIAAALPATAHQRLANRKRALPVVERWKEFLNHG